MGDRPDAGADVGLDETAASGDPRGAAERGEAALPEVSPTRYVVDGEVGRGGIGRVVRARDVALDRTVAIKELVAGDDGARRRFVREALVTARLQHPSIVPIYEAGRWPDLAPFYAMKLVAGKPLATVLDGARTFEARMAHVPTVLAVADAIAYAHGERIIHRDLKPANVLVGAYGETVVIDWGLAKDLAAGGDDDRDAGPYRAAARMDGTAAGAVLGTPAYMAPEQASGDDVDERADVYALGAMLYHVVTGAAPHTGATLDEAIARIVRGEIAPVAEREPRVPPDLAAVIGKAMALAPADRYPTARELAADLRAFTTGGLVGAHRYTIGERVRRWLRRHRAVAAVAAAAIVVLVAYGTWSVRRIVRESARADAERDRAVAAAKEAAAERDAARADRNGAILAQARGLVPHDATRALALLATLAPEAPGWDAARVVAADARSRARVIAHVELRANGLPPIAPHWIVDGAHDRAFLWSAEMLWIVSLADGGVRTIDAKRPIWPDALAPCDDGARLFGWSEGSAGDAQIVELDLAHADAAPVERHVARDELMRMRVACRAELRILIVDDELFAWDAKAGAPRSLLKRVNSAMVSADRAHVVALDLDGALVRWDLDADREEPLGTFGVGRIDGVSRDGSVVAVETATAVTVVGTGGARHEFQGATHGAWLAPDGSWLVLAHDNGTYVNFGEDLSDFHMLTQSPVEISSSDDGHWLFGTGVGAAAAWDLRAGNAEVRLGDEPVGRVADGGRDRAVTYTDEGELRVWSLPRARMITARSTGWATAPGARWLALETRGGFGVGKVIRVDGETGAEDSIARPAPVDDATPMLAYGAIAASGDVIVPAAHAIWRWRRGASAWERLGDAGTPDDLDAPFAGFSAAGVPFARLRDRVIAWDGAAPRAIAVQGKLVAVSDDLAWGAAIDPGRHPAPVSLIDLARGGAGVELHGSSGESLTDYVRFSRDGRHLVTGDGHGDLLVWDVATHTSKPIALGGERPIDVAIAPDGTRVALALPRGALAIDVATGARHLLPTGDAVRDLAFDDAGARLVASGYFGARLWAIDAGESRELADDQAAVLAFAGDAITIALSNGVFRIADDLPRDPRALRDAILALQAPTR